MNWSQKIVLTDIRHYIFLFDNEDGVMLAYNCKRLNNMRLA